MRSVLLLVCLGLVACSSDSASKTPGEGIDKGGNGGGPTGVAAAGGAGGASSMQSGGGSAGSAGNAAGSTTLALPQVYPAVRAATPTALIAAGSALWLGPQGELGTARQALEGGVNLATAVQDRFYSGGPTDLLRIVKDLDDRVQGLQLDLAQHPCLSASPVNKTYELPSGQSFELKLQCLQSFGTGSSGGWVGFGSVAHEPADAGASDSVEGASDAAVDAGAAGDGDAGVPFPGRDFYLVEGQTGGNGGAYHIDANGNVEAWIAVAERDIPANSQVLMHLKTAHVAKTLELALAGAGVGFCAAHLKTNPESLFVTGKTNAPPPPGTEQMVGTQYCDANRAGCFQASALGTDLGADSPTCSAIGTSSFALTVALDADTAADAGTANVTPGSIYTYFSEKPTGVSEF
jgi:hypothetical protein